MTASVVITGKDKGKEGVIDRVMPKDNKVIVTGVNTAEAPLQARRANEQAGHHRQGHADRRVERHVRHKGKPTRAPRLLDRRRARRSASASAPSGEKSDEQRHRNPAAPQGEVQQQIKAQLQEDLGIDNVMQVPGSRRS